VTQPPLHPNAESASTPRLLRSSYTIPVVPPFRLDLTVSALRRLPTNPIDVITPDGRYLHAMPAVHHPAIVHVRQSGAAQLEVTIDSDPVDENDHRRIIALVARTLGIDRDLTEFFGAASELPWLRPLAIQFRGLKPPRYRTLWEAFVNAVVYQQVSLHAASAVVQRIIQAFGTPLESEGVPVHLFPGADRVLAASDDELRGLGLSAGKLATLRRAAGAIAAGKIDSDSLEHLPSVDAAARLRSIKGIGPWTATVILLRGFGRLDVFPMNDSGVARNLSLAAGSAAPDLTAMLETLGAQKGMLYFHLLLARLATRGEVGLPSIPPG
jgi:DNA-3-methyladenine glycosylase II